MKRYICIIVLICMGLSLSAQRRKEKLTLLPSFEVKVDGDLTEWADRLMPVDQDSSWSVAVSNDATFIYAAVRIKDIALQQEAARNGVIININTDGKKRDGAQLIFTIPDSESIRAMINDENLPEMNVREELIRRSRGYGVHGFARIVDGRLSFDNRYGVRAAARLDDQDVLVYESQIPIQALGLSDAQQKVAIQCLLNNRFTMLKQALKDRPSTRAGVYGNRRPTVKSPYRMPTEMWVVTTLNEN